MNGTQQPAQKPAMRHELERMSSLLEELQQAAKHSTELANTLAGPEPHPAVQDIPEHDGSMVGILHYNNGVLATNVTELSAQLRRIHRGLHSD